jgi:hypothetical protein
MKAGESTCPTSAGCRKPLSSDAIWANAQIRARNALILNGTPFWFLGKCPKIGWFMRLFSAAR